MSWWPSGVFSMKYATRPRRVGGSSGEDEPVFVCRFGFEAMNQAELFDLVVGEAEPERARNGANRGGCPQTTPVRPHQPSNFSMHASASASSSSVSSPMGRNGLPC